MKTLAIIVCTLCLASCLNEPSNSHELNVQDDPTVTEPVATPIEQNVPDTAALDTTYTAYEGEEIIKRMDEKVEAAKAEFGIEE